MENTIYNCLHHRGDSRLGQTKAYAEFIIFIIATINYSIAISSVVDGVSQIHLNAFTLGQHRSMFHITSTNIMSLFKPVFNIIILPFLVKFSLTFSTGLYLEVDTGLSV